MPSAAVSPIQFGDAAVSNMNSRVRTPQPAELDLPGPPAPGSADNLGTAKSATAWRTNHMVHHGHVLPGSAATLGSFYKFSADPEPPKFGNRE